MRGSNTQWLWVERPAYNVDVKEQAARLTSTDIDKFVMVTLMLQPRNKVGPASSNLRRRGTVVAYRSMHQ